ncbi:MAG: selenocysteine-specific translation elongation factor [Gammaproteobacteria bacterium]
MKKQLTLGVIGHVDHGKTALVRALTGIETDRLKEEQERGLSIVLGFSYLETEDAILDLIDVPGHEDFIRTMISGATGIDGVLMIVAASEGIMPQTREHFDIAQLLGVNAGIVVMTKADLVTQEELELAKEEIREYLEGSFLQDAEIVETSAQKREGLEDLSAALSRITETAGNRNTSEKFFLPVDRAFAMSGFGAVATGTLRGGTIRPNDSVEILPWGGSATVRGLQVHNETTDAAHPGQRVAINLRGLKKGEIKRGDTLASQGFLKPTKRFDAEVELLPGQKHALKNGVPVRVLVGTSEIIAKVRLLDRKQLEPGETGLIQFRCQRELSTHRSERFILRSTTPVETIGGGRILDLDPPRHRRFDAAVTERLVSTASGDSADMVAKSVNAVGAAGVDIAELQDKLGLDEQLIRSELDAIEAVVIDDQLVVAGDVFAKLSDTIRDAVKRHHADNPRSQGIAAGSLMSSLDVSPHEDIFDCAISDLVANGDLESDNGILRGSGYDPYSSLAESERRVAENIETLFREAGLAPPPVETVTRQSTVHRSIVKLLIDMGHIVPLKTYDRNNKMALHCETLSGVEEQLQQNYPYPKDFAVSDVRDLLGATRKYVVPLMEHLDATGVTIRTGNVRRLREH